MLDDKLHGPKRRFKPTFTDKDRDLAARMIQKSYRGALDRREIQRVLRMKERMNGGRPEPYNFVVDGVKYQFAEKSLCGLGVDNPYRKFVVQIAVNPVFDQFILARRARARASASSSLRAG